MVIAKETVLLPYPAEQVWRVVTDLVDTGWRSDLDHVEILSDNRFAEHTKSGHVTVFATMVQDSPHRWAFTMDNPALFGHWEGRFSAKGKATQLTLTERITVKRWWMRPFAPSYLKRQQRRYLHDLRQKLAEDSSPASRSPSDAEPPENTNPC